MWIVILVVVLLIVAAGVSDLNDRRKGRKVRSSGEMLDHRRERRANFHSTAMHGVPSSDDWHKPIDDKLKDKGRGGV